MSWRASKTEMIRTVAIAPKLNISGIKILKEYERAVIFRLGRLVRAGPGLRCLAIILFGIVQ
jgi:regulator of protease activity HflC (stomatin/prohibitin superfamily)